MVVVVCTDSSPARAIAISISSCVRFFDCKNATRFSSGDDATDGSWRTKRDQYEMIRI